ncbi:tyrosine-type recombinase/integrase [Bacillus weihaiensis]|uniref:tyrosine-type recombinase/integrase n=1 Tax=Bacillus weihaiensis TaxID=1547283 RepID=UPI002356A86C|nr:tyrosine-type recombinase/integrase [Bacillus weihaiensis]
MLNNYLSSHNIIEKSLISLKDFKNLKELSTFMLNDAYYHELLSATEFLDNPNTQQFNDLEMMYLFVHNKKDMNEKKNRMTNTKQEYIRDLLIIYKQLLDNQLLFNIELTYVDKHLTPSLFQSLKHGNLRKYQEWLLTAPLGKGAKPYAVATLSRKMIILKSFLAYLYRSEYIQVPLHEKMLSSNVREDDIPNRDLGSNEVIQLLDYFKDHPIIHCFIAILTTTGLRIKELCNSRICDITYQDGDYWLNVMGKGRKQREVLLHPNIIEGIRVFRLRRRADFVLDSTDDSPIFTTANGNPYSYKYLSNYLTKHINKANITFIRMRRTPITPHFLRHAYAIISAENGATLESISPSLGHSNYRTTARYLEKRLSRKNSASHSWKNSKIIKNL